MRHILDSSNPPSVPPTGSAGLAGPRSPGRGPFFRQADLFGDEWVNWVRYYRSERDWHLSYARICRRQGWPLDLVREHASRARKAHRAALYEIWLARALTRPLPALLRRQAA